MLFLEDKIQNIFNILNKRISWDDLVNYSYEDYTPILDYFDDLWNKYTLEYGATKAVVIPKNCNKVLKIPFHAFVYETNEEDDEDYEQVDFINANSECGWDYCYDEFCKYEQSKEDGFSDFFPETEFYNYIQDGYSKIPVYIQERVNPFRYDVKTLKNSKSYDTARDLVSTMNEHSYRIKRLDIYFITECINFYGKEKTEKFIEYIFLEYPEIGSDLHNANLGRRDDGSPVILDFSGFRE